MNKNVALTLASLLLLTGCQESPTGRNQLALVPQPVMADLGSKSFEEIKARNVIVSDSGFNKVVRCISQYLVRAAENQYPAAPMPHSWEVVVFDSNTPNAFALPGGKIGVHSGLLRVANSPDQLAAVIGHEIAHVLADHGNERLTQELGVKAGLFLVGLFTESEVADEQLQHALGVGAELGITLPFSRAHEEEADLMGLNIMASAGFRPEESIALWRNMAKTSSREPLEFLSTHPNHSSRIDALSAQMDQARALFGRAIPARCSR